MRKTTPKAQTNKKPILNKEQRSETAYLNINIKNKQRSPMSKATPLKVFTNSSNHQQTPSTPILSSIAKSSQPSTPIGKENSDKMRYPDILDKAVKRVMISNAQRPSDGGGVYQSFNSDSQNNASTGYEMVGVPPQPLKESTLVNYMLSNDMSRKSSHDSGYIDYVVSNREVQKFLRRWFTSQDSSTDSRTLRDHSISCQSTTRKLGRSPQPVVCEAWDRVPIAYFIRLLISEYPETIEEYNLSREQMDFLRAKLRDMVGDDEQPQYLSLNKLQLRTKQLGLLGLLLSALKQVEPSQTMQTKEFSTFFKTPDVKQYHQIIQDYVSEAGWQVENTLTTKVNEQLRRLVTKARDVEKLLQVVQTKVTDNFGLFHHETKTKQTIQKLKDQVNQQNLELQKLKEEKKVLEEENHKQKILIQELQAQKKPKILLSVGQSQEGLEERNESLRRTNSVRTSIRLSPSKNANSCDLNILVEMLNLWENTPRHDESKIVGMIIDKNGHQQDIQHQLVIPQLKQVPGLQEFLQRTNHINFLVNYWVVGVYQTSLQDEDSQQSSTLHTPVASSRSSLVISECGSFNGITNLYMKCLHALSTLTKESDALIILRMFLKLTLILITAKRVLNPQTIQAWSQKNQTQDRLIQCFVRSLLVLANFQIESFPWNVNESDKSNVHILLKSASNLAQFRNILLGLRSNSHEIQIQTKLLGMFYSQFPSTECIQLINSEVDEHEAKQILDCDICNLIIFPSLCDVTQNTFPLLQGVLHFKCPGQIYYAQYIEQICRKENVDILADLATQLFNKQGALESIIKIWEILGAIAKSIGLKRKRILYSKDSVEHIVFIVRMYSQNPIYLKNELIISNIRIVQASLNQ